MKTPTNCSPLRLRMIEDMTARNLGPASQRGNIHACKLFASFLGRSPETATPDDVRNFQRYLIDCGKSIHHRMGWESTSSWWRGEMRQLKRTRARGGTVGQPRLGRALAGGAFAAPCVVTLVMMASSFSVAPSRAETAAPKAAECLARPTGLSPKGSHWFYRLDRKNGRRCWYLGPESNRVRRTETTERRSATPAAPERSAAKSVAPTPRDRPASRTVELAPPDVVAQSPAVSATNFSGQWPSVPTAVVPYARGPAAAITGSNTASTVGNGPPRRRPPTRRRWTRRPT